MVACNRCVSLAGLDHRIRGGSRRPRSRFRYNPALHDSDWGSDPASGHRNDDDTRVYNDTLRSVSCRNSLPGKASCPVLPAGEEAFLRRKTHTNGIRAHVSSAIPRLPTYRMRQTSPALPITLVGITPSATFPPVLGIALRLAPRAQNASA